MVPDGTRFRFFNLDGMWRVAQFPCSCRSGVVRRSTINFLTGRSDWSPDGRRLALAASRLDAAVSRGHQSVRRSPRTRAAAKRRACGLRRNRSFIDSRGGCGRCRRTARRWRRFTRRPRSLAVGRAASPGPRPRTTKARTRRLGPIRFVSPSHRSKRSGSRPLAAYRDGVRPFISRTFPPSGDAARVLTGTARRLSIPPPLATGTSCDAIGSSASSLTRLVTIRTAGT